MSCSSAVYHKLCGGCGAIVHYDGSSDGVLNMSNYLVGHDILREYMHSFLHGKYVCMVVYM